jgi:predicted CopG family antitoxin
MKALSEVRWSEVARRAIEERANDLEVMNRIASKSKLTKKDVKEISEKIKRAAANKFNEYSSRH